MNACKCLGLHAGPVVQLSSPKDLGVQYQYSSTTYRDNFENMADVEDDVADVVQAPDDVDEEEDGDAPAVLAAPDSTFGDDDDQAIGGAEEVSNKCSHVLESTPFRVPKCRQL